MKKLGFGLSAVVLAGLLVGGVSLVQAQDAAAPAAAPADAAAPALANDDASLQLLIEEGGPLYDVNCAACHGSMGEGGAGPSLINSAVVRSRSAVTYQILFGATDHGMPPFAPVLNDHEIAAVATYIRNSWNNEFGIILPRSVELRRAAPPEEEAPATP
jgi:mono/diheme cytochrome c family protein